MSRLERHYRRQIKERMFIFIGIFVLCIILLFTVGLPFVLNGSISLSHLFSKQKDDTDRRNPILQSIELDPLPESVNKNSITVSGHAANFDKIQIYVNDANVKEVSLPSDGSFSEDITNLIKGDNKIYVVALSDNGQKQSSPSTVSYLADKPKLEVSDPSDNSTTDHDEVQVKGTTNKDITIKVNDLPVVVDASGGFQTLVKLNEGENKIKIIALDDAGNTEEKTLTVKYEKH